VNRRFPEVVRLQAGREVCTGTIIGPRVVLTAAHCADLKNASFEFHGQRYKVRFTSSSDYVLKGHDIAVAITHRAIRDARYGTVGGASLRHGSVLEIAGYGCTHIGGKSAGLHEGTTRVIGLDGDHVLSFSPQGSVLCSGDSGGPAYLKEGNRRYVVAVNSAGDLKNVNLNVRLDSHLSQCFFKRLISRFHVKICGINLGCRRPLLGEASDPFPGHGASAGYEVARRLTAKPVDR
jgi:V8-like Glu-specific endopeptidase